MTTTSPGVGTAPARPWTAHYDPGVPHEVSVPEMALDGLVRQAAATWPDEVALDFLGARTSFAELDAAVDRMARALTTLGVRRGDRVSLHLPTSPAFVIAFHGAIRAGAIAVPLNPLYVERELEVLFGATRPALSVTLDLVAPRVRAARRTVLGEDGSRPGTIVACGIQDMLRVPLRWLYPLAARRHGRWHPIADSPAEPNLFRLLTRTPAGPVASPAAADDPAALLVTGGTTGTPKAAVLSHRNLVANALQVVAWNSLPRQAGDAVMCALPYFHSYGLTVAMDFALVRGSTQVMVPTFDVVQVLKAIARTRPRLFPGAPIMYQAIADHPSRGRYDLRSIEACISGAAPLPEVVQERFESATGGRVVEGYGLTEASPVTHSNPVRGARRLGTVGLPFPSTDAEVVDLENGTRLLPPGEPGELRVRGPQVMQGYWERPAESAQVLRDGWLYTGDVAVMSEDGYFSIVDRRKDLVIVGGLNVFPREVEEVLLTHPAVSEAAVIGVPEARHGEVPRAYVVLRPGMPATPEQLVEHCFANLARYKVPRSIEIRDELPRSFVGKVLRRVLEEEAAAAGGPRPGDADQA